MNKETFLYARSAIHDKTKEEGRKDRLSVDYEMTNWTPHPPTPQAFTM